MQRWSTGFLGKLRPLDTCASCRLCLTLEAGVLFWQFIYVGRLQLLEVRCGLLGSILLLQGLPFIGFQYA